MKKLITILFLIIIFLSGCGDSSEEQIIIVYDYSNDKEIQYDKEDKEINNFVNNLCDFLMDGEQTEVKVPSSALNYKKIMLYQEKNLNNKQETDVDRLMDIEIYKYNDDFYCKAKLYFSEQNCEMKLSLELTQQIKAIWDS